MLLNLPWMILVSVPVQTPQLSNFTSASYSPYLGMGISSKPQVWSLYTT